MNVIQTMEVVNTVASTDWETLNTGVLVDLGTKEIQGTGVNVLVRKRWTQYIPSVKNKSKKALVL